MEWYETMLLRRFKTQTRLTAFISQITHLSILTHNHFLILYFLLFGFVFFITFGKISSSVLKWFLTYNWDFLDIIICVIGGMELEEVCGISRIQYFVIDVKAVLLALIYVLSIGFS